MGKLTDEEFRDFLKTCRELAEGPFEEMQREVEVTNKFPQEFIDLARENNLYRYALPEQYGGWGFTEKEIPILKMVNHLVPKDAGTIALGSRVHIGYYDQEHQVLSLHKTIFEEISDAYPDLTNTKIRNVLAAFLFTGDDVFKKIEDLSGGERGRVSLAKLMLSPANFLILDEPTNHLDIQSKGILEDAIRSYTGTVFVVSHDRYFINRIATRILELKDEQLYSFIGNYDYYESHKDQVYEAAAPKQTDTSADTATAPSATPSGKDDYKKQKEEQARLRKKENDIKKTEQKIEETEAAIAQIDEEFLNPEYATNSAKLGELSKKREELEETLSALYETWETLLA